MGQRGKCRRSRTLWSHNPVGAAKRWLRAELVEEAHNTHPSPCVGPGAATTPGGNRTDAAVAARSSSPPRYAAITSGLFTTSLGFPFASSLPKFNTYR